MICENLNYVVRSVIGNRDEQQDCVDVFSDDDFFAAVVCDGMGGLNGGSAASKIAVNKAVESFSQREQFDSIPDMFINSIDILDEAVYTLTDANGNRLEAGSTIVSICIENSNLYWMSVGDSRLYILRNNEMIQATRDHNFSLYLDSVKDSYSPTAEDIDSSDALISFLGMGGISTMDISSNPVLLEENDIILITSDGLYKVLDDEKIKIVISEKDDIEDAANQLLLLAEQSAPDTRDNISFILIKYYNKEERKK